MKRRLLCLALLPTLTPAQTTRQQSRPVYRCGNAVSDRPPMVMFSSGPR